MNWCYRNKLPCLLSFTAYTTHTEYGLGLDNNHKPKRFETYKEGILIYFEWFASITCTKKADLSPPLLYKQISVNSSESGPDQFFITTLSTTVLPQMPFIRQILNRKCLIYQTGCKNPLCRGDY